MDEWLGEIEEFLELRQYNSEHRNAPGDEEEDDDPYERLGAVGGAQPPRRRQQPR